MSLENVLTLICMFSMIARICLVTFKETLKKVVGLFEGGRGKSPIGQIGLDPI